MKDWRGIAFPVAIVAAAELGADLTGFATDTLVSPSRILFAGLAALFDGSAVTAAAQTLIAAAGGLLLGAGAGLIAGVALGLSRPLAAFSSLSIEMLRAIPAIALVPLGLLVFGVGYAMEVAVVAFACFWPVLMLAWHASAQIDPRLIEVARILQLGTFATVAKIILPAAAPRLFTALRIAAGLALVVAVTVEVVANPLGFGHALMTAQETLHPDVMLATLLLLGVIGLALNALLSRWQRTLFVERGGTEAEPF
jgi:ABC-type nitrate/sulfonate/bicarbonate transport system permease component